MTPHVIRHDGKPRSFGHLPQMAVPVAKDVAAPPSPPANRNVHDARFLEGLTATMVAAAIFALIGLIYLSITGG